MRRRVRLTESDLHKFITESVKRSIIESMTENDDSYDKWEWLKHNLDPKAMLDYIGNYISDNELERIIDKFEEDGYLCDYDEYNEEYEQHFF